MIKIKDLSVYYKWQNQDITALENLNIDIESGEIYTFIGPSGCGKSTLLYVLSGINKEYGGEVSIDGRAIDPKTQRIGLILQNYGLVPWKTVYQNAMLGLKIKKDRYGLDDYSSYIFEQLGINDLLKRYPKELSGGQQQRVAIARAFVMRPDLLLMDEPFSALDAITREEIQELFLNIWKEHKVTTVFITHSVDEALYLGSRIVVLSSAPGTVLENIENPCFMMEDLRSKDEYHLMASHLRERLSAPLNTHYLDRPTK